MIDAQKLVELGEYFTPIHHTKGRLRVRVSPKIKEQSENIDIKDIENLSKKIEGIKEVKINKLIGSITISYDHNIFKKELWDNLIAGENLDEVVTLVNKLYKEVV